MKELLYVIILSIIIIIINFRDYFSRRTEIGKLNFIRISRIIFLLALHRIFVHMMYNGYH